MNTQKQKANAAMLFAKILTRNCAGRVTSVLVPGTDGKNYTVHVSRDGATMHTSCFCNTTGKPCLSQTVCYHALAAIQVIANDGGHGVVWCKSEEGAHNLLHLGGVGVVSAERNNKKKFGVIK